MVEIVKVLKKEPQRATPEPAPEPAPQPAAEDKDGGSQVADAMLEMKVNSQAQA